MSSPESTGDWSNRASEASPNPLGKAPSPFDPLGAAVLLFDLHATHLPAFLPLSFAG